jgi:hypothetical protein
VLSEAGAPHADVYVRPRTVDPMVPFIVETLAKHRHSCASDVGDCIAFAAALCAGGGVPRSVRGWAASEIGQRRAVLVRLSAWRDQNIPSTVRTG